jgi:hypothetical protein
MIDNYPQDRDYNALCSELREMREQKERLYFRDEALNRPSEPPTKRKRSKKRSSKSSTSLDPMILTQMVQDITPKTESTLLDDVLGILFLMVAAFFICYFIYIIA